MSSVSKLGRGKHRPLSDRQRYVARARYLAKHPPFKAAIVDARGEWDAAHPAFAIGKPTYPPTPLPFPIPDGAAVPPKLDAGLRADDERMRRAVRDGTNLYNDAEAGPWVGASYAEFGWRAFVGRLAAEWWPPRWYPIAPGPMTHPARRFVSGCLLWGTEHAREEWIAWPLLQPTWLPAPVHEVTSPAEVAFWKTQAEALYRGIMEAVEGDHPLTVVAVRRMADAAFAEGTAAERSATEALRHRVLPYAGQWASTLCVPIHPGMTGEDWDDAKAIVLANVRDRDKQPRLRAEARRLHAEGKSVRKVAGMLGVARPTIDGWISGPD